MRAWSSSCRHTVLAMDGRTEAAKLASGDINLVLIDRSSGGGSVGALRTLIVQQQPDLVLSYNWGAVDAAIAARSLGWRRLVHHEDGFNLDEAHRLKARRNWLRRLVLAPYDVVVPSRGLEAIAKKVWRLSNVHFIANGIDAAAFSRDEGQGAAFREALGIPLDAVLIGAVGHLRPVKNYGRLIRAAAATGRDVHLVFIGDGAERASLEQLAVRSGVKASFSGHIENLRPAYSALNIFAISSDSEQQPVALLEAMAASLPVCATDVGDVRTSLPERSQRNVVRLDSGADGLAGVLRRLVDDPDERRELGALNLQHVQRHYTETAMQDAYARVYGAALRR